MRIEDAGEWPGNQWPRFIELLRVFCLSDDEQDAFFPEFQKPHYHASADGDGYTLSSYSPALSDVYDMAVVFSMRCEENEEEMFGHLCEAFRRARDVTLHLETGDVPRLDLGGLLLVRPQLRALCSQALQLFDEEIKPPALSWEQLISY